MIVVSGPKKKSVDEFKGTWMCRECLAEVKLTSCDKYDLYMDNCMMTTCPFCRKRTLFDRGEING